MNPFLVIPTSRGFVLHAEETNVESSSSLPSRALSLSVDPHDPTLLQIATSENTLDASSGAAVRAHALLGIARGVSKRTFYLFVVTVSTLVGTKSKSFAARSVDAVKVMSFPGQDMLETSADRLQIQYMESALRRNIPFLYFSQTHDIIHTVQAQQRSSTSTNNRVSEFVWNWKLLEPLCNATVPSSWIHPIIQGLVACKEKIRVLDLTFDLVLITRRSTSHQGTRFNCRGLDSNGCAANYCETEQIALFNNGDISSYVQVRGSVPTLWDQVCSLTPVKQKVIISPHAETEGYAAFKKHLQTQIGSHSAVSKPAAPVVLINLVDKYGTRRSSKDQAELGKTYEEHVLKLSSEMQEAHSPKVKLVWFDFHHETIQSQGGWENLGRLLEQVRDDLTQIGSFICEKHTMRTVLQNGLFRVNCMDNLDRTNVVQSMFARTALLHQLAHFSTENAEILLHPKTNSVFDSGFPDLESGFKDMWADNANAVSLAYTGSFALKTDFTRTGKLSLAGRLQDSMNSTLRLFVNNFLDANKQDDIDVLLLEEAYIHKLLERVAAMDPSAGRKKEGSIAERLWGTPTRMRLLLLTVCSLGFFTRFGQQHQVPYLAVLVSIATYVIMKQSGERPKFSRM